MRGSISDGQDKNQELRVEWSSSKLTISIGVDVLAFSADRSEAFQPYDMESGNWVQAFRVNDPDGFARDVARELNREGEDGSTPISRLLDKMALAALEDGSEYTYECPAGTPILGEIK